MDKDDALQFLKRVKKCLKGKEWSLTCGTLLGAVRDGDFIDWDIDVDVLLREKYHDKFPEIVECLRAQGCSARIITDFEAEFIQIYYRNCPGHIGLTTNPPLGVWWYEMFFAGKMKTINIRGEDFPVPEKAEELLTLRYGDWKKPLSLNEWNNLWKKEREAKFKKLNIDNRDKLKNIK